MAGDEKKAADAYDVVWVHGKTADGEGAAVVRARPGKLEAGELRPLRDGQPLAAHGEVVSLEPRADSPRAFDVKVEVDLGRGAKNAGGPAQVATDAYRDSWERTFGPRRSPRSAAN